MMMRMMRMMKKKVRPKRRYEMLDFCCILYVCAIILSEFEVMLIFCLFFVKLHKNVAAVFICTEGTPIPYHLDSDLIFGPSY